MLRPKWSGRIKRYWPQLDFIYGGKTIKIYPMESIPKNNIYLVYGNNNVAKIILDKDPPDFLAVNESPNAETWWIGER
jgi:hypothetical protein